MSRELTKKDIYSWLDEKLMLEDWNVLEMTTEQMATVLEHYLEPETPRETWIIYYANISLSNSRIT